MKVERVTEYKYLGTVLDNKLNFNKNTEFIHIRCQPRIISLQKLKSLNVSAVVLRTFYRSCIESVLTFSCLCWFGGLNVKSKNVLNKLVYVCGKVVGERQERAFCCCCFVFCFVCLFVCFLLSFWSFLVLLPLTF